jgi:hypothetical protein
MNLKKIAMGLAAALIALLLIYFSIPQIKKPSAPSEADSSETMPATNSPAAATQKPEPPMVLPMPGAPPPVPPKKK